MKVAKHMIVVMHTHRHGVDLKLFKSVEEEQAAYLGNAIDDWSRREDMSAPDDYESLTNKEICAAFYDNNVSESWESSCEKVEFDVDFENDILPRICGTCLMIDVSAPEHGEDCFIPVRIYQAGDGVRLDVGVNDKATNGLVAQGFSPNFMMMYNTSIDNQSEWMSMWLGIDSIQALREAMTSMGFSEEFMHKYRSVLEPEIDWIKSKTAD